ncbi:MAG: DUF1573 domain-containing protein [bacterium]|nr:DUF1573 domain-containing protein [bacterium]
MTKQNSNKMNKKIIASITIVLGIIGLIFWGRNSVPVEIPKNLGSATALSASEILYDFGTISMQNGLTDHVFKVTNPSEKDIFIKNVSTSCMCTKVYIEGVNGNKGPFGMEGHGYVPPANEIIKAGESRNIKVVYDPNAHGPAGIGFIDRFIYLADQSGDTFQLEIKAVVTP